jgi:hypothetical protein
MGLMLDYSPIAWLSLGCGAGTNFYFQTSMGGLEAACMLRFRPVRDRERSLAFGFGGSVGPFEKTEVAAMGAFAPLLGPMTQIREGPGPLPRVWDTAGWLNFEIGYERRTLVGVTFRVYLGISQLLNPYDARPLEPVSDPYGSVDVVSLETTLLYFGVALGRAW